MLHKLKILKKLHNELTKEADIQSVLTLIVKETLRLLKADRCTIYIYDPIKNELWSKVVSKLEVNEIRLKLGKGIAGYVGETREIINVDDAYNDDRFNKSVDELTSYKTKSILAAPMINPSNQLIGIMEVINKKDENEFFTQTDEFFISILSGISAVAIQQAQLYESNYSLRRYNETIIENVNNAIVVLDEKFKVVLINAAFKSIFKVDEHEIEGEKLIHVIPQFDFFKHQFKKLQEGKNSAVIEKELNFFNEIKYFNINFSVIKSHNENFLGYILVISDITEEIKAKLEKKKEENLSLIGKMLTAILHDVKNPLAAIKGFAELIDIKSNNDDFKDYTKIIVRETERLNAMTKEILDFAKGETTLNLTGIKASEFIKELKVYLDNEFEKINTKYEILLDEDFDFVVDTGKLLRAVVNIAKNSAEALAKLEDKKPFFRITFKKKDDTVIIKMADNGPGIQKSMLKKIFQPFYTRGKKAGTGLGLAIVKKMIADHKGIIKIWSEEKKGTVFTFELPAGEVKSFQ